MKRRRAALAAVALSGEALAAVALVGTALAAAALAGVIVFGAREGRFGPRGQKRSMEPFAASSIPLVTLGTFLLWFGWY